MLATAPWCTFSSVMRSPPSHRVPCHCSVLEGVTGRGESPFCWSLTQASSCGGNLWSSARSGLPRWHVPRAFLIEMPLSCVLCLACDWTNKPDFVSTKKLASLPGEIYQSLTDNDSRCWSVNEVSLLWLKGQYKIHTLVVWRWGVGFTEGCSSKKTSSVTTKSQCWNVFHACVL